MKVTVTKREAYALAHWRKCSDCRETKEGAVDDTVGCLAISFAPINARMRELQEEYAVLEAEKMELVEASVPRELRSSDD